MRPPIFQGRKPGPQKVYLRGQSGRAEHGAPSGEWPAQVQRVSIQWIFLPWGLDVALTEAGGATSEVLSAQPGSCDYCDMTAACPTCQATTLSSKVACEPHSPPWRPALLAPWAAGDLSLLCFCETIRRASGLGGWVAKSFPLARPYHGLRSLQAKFSLAQREGGRVGGGKERGPQEPQTKLPSLGPWRTSTGAGRGSHELCGLHFGKAAGMMQLVLLSYTMSTTHPLSHITPQLCWYSYLTEGETEPQRGWHSPQPTQ